MQSLPPAAVAPGAADVIDLRVGPPAASEPMVVSFSDPLASRRRYVLAKRVLDVVMASVLLVLLLPVVIMVAIAVKASSSGPVLFTHERLGYRGRTIRCRKFRTMIHESGDALDTELSEAFARQYKLAADPRVTPVGRVLRRLSLDELPQLLNVVDGSMSLIGPRPIVMDEAVAKWGGLTARLVQVKPGLSGLWQVSGRSDLDYVERIRLDLEYVERCSLALDLRLLLRTVPAVLFVRGAT